MIGCGIAALLAGSARWWIIDPGSGIAAEALGLEIGLPSALHVQVRLHLASGSMAESQGKSGGCWLSSAHGSHSRGARLFPQSLSLFPLFRIPCFLGQWE